MKKIIKKTRNNNTFTFLYVVVSIFACLYFFDFFIYSPNTEIYIIQKRQYEIDDILKKEKNEKNDFYQRVSDSTRENVIKKLKFPKNLDTNQDMERLRNLKKQAETINKIDAAKIEAVNQSFSEKISLSEHSDRNPSQSESEQQKKDQAVKALIKARDALIQSIYTQSTMNNKDIFIAIAETQKGIERKEELKNTLIQEEVNKQMSNSNWYKKSVKRIEGKYKPLIDSLKRLSIPARITVFERIEASYSIERQLLVFMMIIAVFMYICYILKKNL